MVAPQTNPDYVPAMKKAAAIVTEKGGRTSHAAIVSRELGIPAVVGADRATKILKQDMIVTVNGEAGEIYKGKVIVNKPAKLVNSLTSKQKKQLKTLTKIYVNLAQPEEATKVAKMNVDGVGLLRAEFIIADIGVHPKEFIKNKKESVFINRLERELLKFVGPFSPRPVVYRATDFKTNEYRSLKGGSYYEPKEENPMLGYRGCYRYLNDTPGEAGEPIKIGNWLLEIGDLFGNWLLEIGLFFIVVMGRDWVIYNRFFSIAHSMSWGK